MKFHAILTCGLLALCLGQTEAAIINAKSISLVDVTSAVNSANAGDTVIVPAGTAVWTSGLAISKNITISGAGIGSSVLIDELPRTPPFPGIIAFATTGNTLVRFTGFTIQGGTINTAGYIHGIFQVSGTSQSLRIDHCLFTNLYASPVIAVSDALGVIDHCKFYTQGQAMQVYAANWNNGDWGSGSWADDPYWGSGKFLYIEDNTFYCSMPLGGGVDSYEGARWVFRHNMCTNGSLTLHGTEGQGRGAKQLEAYNNLFVSTTATTLGQFRSGSGLIFSNQFVNYSCQMVLQTYRMFRISPYFGSADGTNAWDMNDANGLYASGTHNGSDSSPVLVDANASWTPGQWVGYVIKNMNVLHSTGNFTNVQQSIITDNTATTITYSLDQGSGGQQLTNLLFNAGDPYQIWHVITAIDQPGHGKGDLVSGLPPVPVGWPNEVIEPIYSWQNWNNGTQELDIISSDPGMVNPGRDFFNATPKPGYTPYIYPHPLTLIPDPPRNLSVMHGS